jgi:NAD(P)-dependent dehydrogenase (short-subunit alcohol dehydrogenase family)
MTERSILVTGCSSGFGLLITVELARRGHRVFATMRDPEGRDDKLRAALATETGPAADRVEVLRLDVTDDATIADAVATVLERAGRLDVVVNNAGVAGGNAVEETSVEELAAVFETNVFGPLRVTQAALPAMRAQQAGHIVNVTSVAAFVAPPFMGAYAASKHATDALGEALAAEVAPFGIHVTNVAPGAYLTEMVGAVDDALASVDDASPYAERLRTMLGNHGEAMRRQANPAEVAVAVADAIDADPPPARVVVPASSAGVVTARGATPPEQLRSLLAASYGI